jgi:hypothetical protein
MEALTMALGYLMINLVMDVHSWSNLVGDWSVCNSGNLTTRKGGRCNVRAIKISIVASYNESSRQWYRK